MGIVSFSAFAALMAAGLVSQTATVPTAPAPMSPTQKWVLNYAESMCVLSREYGTEAKPLTFGLRPSPMGDYVRIAILQAEDSNAANGKANIAFDGNPAIEAPYMGGPISTPGMYILFVDTKWSQLNGFNTAKVMSIDAGRRHIVLNLSGVPAALKALKVCEKDLLVNWGLDPKLVDRLETMPSLRGGPATIFSVDDYPAAAIRAQSQGTAGVRFWVSKEGKASDCRVVESSGTKVLDETTCNIIVRRGKYDPARTTSGEAIDSPAFTRVRWLLPSD